MSTNQEPYFDLITFVADGWAELRLAGPGDHPRVLVKIGERGGRGAIEALLIFGEQLDSQTLKSIPVARVESAVNHPRFGPLPTPKFQLSETQMRELAEHGHLFPDEFAAINQALESYVTKRPEPGGATPRTRQTWRRHRKPLTRPDGTDPDGFSQRVAEAYNDAILTTSKPAPVLAAEAGVPVTTVHRWIAEARRRGHLPPARKGRAG